MVQISKFQLVVLFSIMLACIKSIAFAVSNEPNQNLTKISISELQWSLCEEAAVAFHKLQKKQITYKQEEQFYFDFADLALSNNNLEFRIREKDQDYSGVLKTSFIAEKDIPSLLLKSKNTVCELDKHETKEAFGCKTKNKSELLSKVMSSEQIQILKSLFPAFDYNQLKTYGPFAHEVWTTRMENGGDLDIDSISSKGGKKYFEISIRVKAIDRQLAYQSYTNYFKEKNLQLCPAHVSRSRLVLTGN